MPNTNKGVLVDRTPILQDMRDTYVVSFLLPDNEPYIALFKGADGIEHRTVITDSKCKIPKELLKEQFVELRVCKIDNDKILHTWECEPLKVTAFLHMRKTQLELSSGMTDKDLYERLAELEQNVAEYNTLLTTLRSETTEQDIKHSQATQALQATLDTIKEQNKALATNYNNAIAVINDLSARLAALEKNYDPTVIN